MAPSHRIGGDIESIEAPILARAHPSSTSHQVDRMDLALIRDWGGKVRVYTYIVRSTWLCFLAFKFACVFRLRRCTCNTHFMR